MNMLYLFVAYILFFINFHHTRMLSNNHKRKQNDEEMSTSTRYKNQINRLKKLKTKETLSKFTRKTAEFEISWLMDCSDDELKSIFEFYEQNKQIHDFECIKKILHPNTK